MDMEEIPGSSETKVEQTFSSDEGKVDNASSLRSSSSSLRGSENFFSCDSVATEYRNDDSGSEKSERHRGCSEVLLKLTRRNRIADTKEDQEGYRHFWPSHANSACALIVLHIGASPLILVPAMCLKYGSIMSYILVIFVVFLSATPMQFLEVFTGHTIEKCISEALGRMGPLLRALGHALLVLTVLMSIYYMEFVSWMLVYLYHSTRSHVPWSNCSSLYNSRSCYSEPLQHQCNSAHKYLVYYDFHCMSATDFCRVHGFLQTNGTHCWGVQSPESRIMHRQLAPDPDIDEAVSFEKVNRRVPPETDFFRTFISGSDWSDTGDEVQQRQRTASSVAYAVASLLLFVLCLSLKLSSTFAKAVVCLTPVLLLIVTIQVLTLPGGAAGVFRLFSSPPQLSGEAILDLCADAVFLAHTAVGAGAGIVATVASRDLPRIDGCTCSATMVPINLLLGLVTTVLLFASRGYLETQHAMAFRPSSSSELDAVELVIVSLSATFHRIPYGELHAILFFFSTVLHSLAALAIVITSVVINLQDSLPFFAVRPLYVAALGVCSVSFGCGFLLAEYSWPAIRSSVTHVLNFQWALGLLLLALALSMKIFSQNGRTTALQSTLGPRLKQLALPLRFCWQLVAPLAAVSVLVVSGGRISAPDGTSAMNVVGYVVLVLPALAAFATALRVCQSVPFWSLLANLGKIPPKETEEPNKHLGG